MMRSIGVWLVVGMVFCGAALMQKAAAEPVADVDDFDKLSARWTDLLSEMRKNFRDYQYCKTYPERNAIIERQNGLAKEGDELEQKLASAAAGALENGSKNVSVAAEFLVAAAKDMLELGRFVKAEDSLAALTKHRDALSDLQQAWLDNTAAENAYYLGDLDRADKLISDLAKSGPLPAPLPDVKAQVQTLLPTWQAEQEIRHREAQADDLPRVKFTTSKGDIVIELFENEAPIATANMINLVESHFYDGIRFHRVLDNFMAQVGDPATVGKPALKYSIPDECYQPNFRHHFRGSVSMAKTNAKDSGDSQFFITFAATSHLDGKHTVFGRVIEGMDVVDSLQRMDPDKPKGVTPDTIISAEVLRKRSHEYQPKKIEK